LILPPARNKGLINICNSKGFGECETLLSYHSLNDIKDLHLVKGGVLVVDVGTAVDSVEGTGMTEPTLVVDMHVL
jgi:hypothetical protein